MAAFFSPILPKHARFASLWSRLSLPDSRFARLRYTTTEAPKKKCDPYEQGGRPLPPEEAKKLIKQIPEWSLVEESRILERTWTSQDLSASSEFIQRIAILSQNVGHNPLFIGVQSAKLGKQSVTVRLSTMPLGGLSYHDFLLALKVDFLRPPTPPAPKTWNSDE
mmetsp:Transcript_32194/g.85888  ORF Transcript_32194/g.85888 Transcript_32194/m.85888 type:complete len:165 (+) Transcript_32194:821-1315(+)